MKFLLYTTIITCLIIGCKKELRKTSSEEETTDLLIEKVNPCLKNLLSDADYSSIDFSKKSLAIAGDKNLLQLGFKSKNFGSDFLMLETDSIGNCIDGRIIHLERNDVRQQLFDGKIIAQDLHRREVISSDVNGGYITALHPKRFADVASNGTTESNIVPSQLQTLPDIIGVGYLDPTGSISTFADYMSFQAVFGVGSGSVINTSGTYGQIGGSLNRIGSSLPKVLTIKNETSPALPAIDVTGFMKCFSNIPDAGSLCSISIYTDLPVDNNPDIFFNWYAGATGHVFLQLTKSGQDRVVNQVIGFAPQKPMQAMFGPNAVASKIVDNGGHKYNASLTMNISPAQLMTAISKILFLSATMQYDIAKYNCVDFALQVINTIRDVNPLIIPRYPIPGQDDITKSNTPQGLYKLLQQKKNSNDAEAKNIVVGGAWNANPSGGACK